MKEEELKKTWNEVYFSENCHEKDIIDDLPNLLKECDVFYDIGASGGQYTFFANKILKNKNIIAVEADPIRYGILSKSCNEWAPINSNKIEAIHAALYERNDEFIDFYVTENNVSGALFINNHIKNYLNEKDLKIEKVKTITLDELFKPYSNNKIFVKIDVEGAEFSAFRGSYNELNKYNITFLIEIHTWKDSNSGLYPWQIFGFLNKAGFAPYYYKNHFIIKKTGSFLKRNWLNLFYSIIFRFKFLIGKLK